MIVGQQRRVRAKRLGLAEHVGERHIWERGHRPAHQRDRARPRRRRRWRPATSDRCRRSRDGRGSAAAWSAPRTWWSPDARDTRRNHSPASKRFCTTEVLPEYKLPSMPRAPPTWKNGTHIIPTEGAASARNGRRHSADPRAQLPAGDADRLRESGRAAGEQDQGVAPSAVFGGIDGLAARRRRRSPTRSASVNIVLRPASRSRSAYGLSRDADVGAAGVLQQPPQLRRCQRGVHQRRRGADARRAEHRRDRQQASAVDDGDAGRRPRRRWRPGRRRTAGPRPPARRN